MPTRDFEVDVGPSPEGGIEIVARKDGGGTSRVNMTAPSIGAVVGSPRARLRWFGSLGATSRELAPEDEALGGGPSGLSVEDVGDELFRALFTGAILGLFDEVRREAAASGDLVRLRLDVRIPSLAMLPWELLFDSRPGNHKHLVLSRGMSVVRSPEQPTDLAPVNIAPPLRILAVASSPRDLPKLDLEREKRSLEDLLRPLEVSGKAKLVWRDEIDAAALSEALSAEAFHVFHFAGHGYFDRRRDKGFVALTGRGGELERLSAEALGTMLSNAGVKLAFLNSCEGAVGSRRGVFSSMAAKLVAMGVPAVLAMQLPVRDEAAVEFAAAFYERLAEGLTIEEAVLRGRQRMGTRDIERGEWAIPVLYTRAKSGALLSTGEAARVEPSYPFAPRPPPPPLPARPYPVLEPYTHPDTFEGRDAEIAAMLADLGKQRLLTCLYGMSGSGKSSFLEAGVVPALRDQKRAVATTRRPDEPGLAQRLLQQILVVPEGFGMDDHEVERFASIVERARSLAKSPPVFVLDQFEDAIRYDEKGAALARVGPLLAATAARSVGDRGFICQWILAYRQEYHGAVVQWLRDVLVNAKELGGIEPKVLAELPRDLSRVDYLATRAILPLGTPMGPEDRRAFASKAFFEAITKPLQLKKPGGGPAYAYRFAEGEAERLADAFADARAERPRAPLAPELQVVLEHLLGQSIEKNGVREVRLGEDPKKLIVDALSDHLDRKLREAFVGVVDPAQARRARTYALLVLRELANEQGQRSVGIPEAELEKRLGSETKKVLEILERPDLRLVLKEPMESSLEQHYVLPHDALAKVVVKLFEDPKAAQEKYGLDEELIRLQKEIALRVALDDTGLSEKTFQQIVREKQRLTWDEARSAWWGRCEEARARALERAQKEAQERAFRERRRIGLVAVLGATLLAAVSVSVLLWVKTLRDKEEEAQKEAKRVAEAARRAEEDKALVAQWADRLQNASDYEVAHEVYGNLVKKEKERANQLKAAFLVRKARRHEVDGKLDIALIERLEAEVLRPTPNGALEVAHLFRKGLRLPEDLRFRVLRHGEAVEDVEVDAAGDRLSTRTASTSNWIWDPVSGQLISRKTELSIADAIIAPSDAVSNTSIGDGWANRKVSPLRSGLVVVRDFGGDGALLVTFPKERRTLDFAMAKGWKVLRDGWSHPTGDFVWRIETDGDKRSLKIVEAGQSRTPLTTFDVTRFLAAREDLERAWSNTSTPGIVRQEVARQGGGGDVVWSGPAAAWRGFLEAIRKKTDDVLEKAPPGIKECVNSKLGPLKEAVANPSPLPSARPTLSFSFRLCRVDVWSSSSHEHIVLQQGGTLVLRDTAGNGPDQQVTSPFPIEEILLQPNSGEYFLVGLSSAKPVSQLFEFRGGKKIRDLAPHARFDETGRFVASGSWDAPSSPFQASAASFVLLDLQSDPRQERVISKNYPPHYSKEVLLAPSPSNLYLLQSETNMSSLLHELGNDGLVQVCDWQSHEVRRLAIVPQMKNIAIAVDCTESCNISVVGLRDGPACMTIDKDSTYPVHDGTFDVGRDGRRIVAATSSRAITFFTPTEKGLVLEATRYLSGEVTESRKLLDDDGTTVKVLVTGEANTEERGRLWLDTVRLDLDPAENPPLPGTAAELLPQLAERLALEILPTGEVKPKLPPAPSSSP